MSNPNIDATLSAADALTITEDLNDIKQKMPFLVTLSNEERKGLFKTGASRWSWMPRQLSRISPISFPPRSIRPRSCATWRCCRSSTKSSSRLIPWRRRYDTCVALGSESGQQALQVYEYGKAAQDTVPGLRPLVEQLGQHFQHSTQVAAPTPAKP